MAQMTSTSANDPLAASPSEREAVQRVVLYFQSIGLPQEKATAVAEEIVRGSQAKWTRGDSGLAGRAMDRAMTRIAEWFDRLAASAGAPTPGTHAQLGWNLRPLLRAHPEVFLVSQDLPEDFRRAVAAACKPLLPLMAPRMMPPQSLWQLPHVWQRAIAYAYLMWYRLRTMRWVGRT